MENNFQNNFQNKIISNKSVKDNQKDEKCN